MLGIEIKDFNYAYVTNISIFIGMVVLSYNIRPMQEIELLIFTINTQTYQQLKKHYMYHLTLNDKGDDLVIDGWKFSSLLDTPEDCLKNYVEKEKEMLTKYLNTEIKRGVFLLDLEVAFSRKRTLEERVKSKTAREYTC